MRRSGDRPDRVARLIAWLIIDGVSRAIESGVSGIGGYLAVHSFKNRSQQIGYEEAT